MPLDIGLVIVGKDLQAMALRFDPRKVAIAALGCANETKMILEQEINKRTPVATGTTKRGNRFYVEGAFPGNIDVYAENRTKGAYYAENGRRPGKMPPPAPIRRWMQARGISDQGGTLFLIRRKIGREGTEGAHMFRDGYAVAKQRYPVIWRKVAKSLS